MQVTGSGKKKYAETKRLLRNAMSERQLVLFVGAGASVDAGMPLWPEAIARIAEKLDLGDAKNANDSLIVPQYYYNSRGRKEYTQLMREVFHHNDKLYPQEVHKSIIRFNTETIITTNYDHLLEQAAEDNGEFLQVISQDSDLPYRKAGKELIKMHGDFEHDNFVLKEDDYLNYHRHFKLIENYVKSLIGSKTVLFIGYSFSDPDVKQIFAWVKDILDEHFQRAYMIITGRKADQNEIEYYKHWGINIIYATDLLDVDDNSIKNHSNQLIDTLDYLLDDEESQKSITDSLYDSLKPFAVQNYTYRKYIERAFYKLRNSINESITLRVEDDNYVVHADEHALEDDEKFLKELDNAIKGDSKNPKMKVIAEALKKSVIKGTCRRVLKKGTKQHIISTCFTTNNEDPDWIEAVYNYDFKKLDSIKEYNSKILSESKPELYLQQASICSFLGDYLSAYYCLDNAATYFYRKREYAWYFISVWNKKHIARIIDTDFFYRSKVDKKTLALIKKDYNNIDLDKTLQTIPDLGHERNRFLSDLKDFKFSSDLFYDVFSYSMKVNEQANTTYFMFAGLPAYEQIRQNVYDYYRYGLYNYLLVDRYRENNEIFSLFTHSIFASVSAPNKDTSTMSIFGNAGNVHAEALNSTDIHLVLRYIDAVKLRKLFDEFNIKSIEITDDSKEYLIKIADNIKEVFTLEKFYGYDVFWRLVCMASHIKIDSVLATSIIRTLSSLESIEYSYDRSGFLKDFINAVYLQELFKSEELCHAAHNLTDYLIDFISKDPGRLYEYRSVIIMLVSFCKEGGCMYDNEVNLKKILAEEYHQLLSSVYTGSSDRLKSIIKGYFQQWSCPDTAKGYITYSELVLAKVIPPDERVEDNTLSFISKHYNNKQKELKSGIVTHSESDSIEGLLLNLYLDGSIQNEDKLKEIISNYGDEFSKWLMAPEKFDYNHFELSWLSRCYPSLLTKLAENKKVRQSILGVFKDKYQSVYYENQINDIIIKYFV